MCLKTKPRQKLKTWMENYSGKTDKQSTARSKKATTE